LYFGACNLEFIYIMEYYEKIAKILRTDKDTVRGVEDFLGRVTGKHVVMDAIGVENEHYMQERLTQLGLTRKAHAKEVFNALIERIDKNDKQLHEAMGRPKWEEHAGCVTICDFLKKEVPEGKGFFLKKERFIELLEKEPPHAIMESFGYTTVSEVFTKEDWREVAAALRFLQGNEWINTRLLPHYKDLTPQDFEEREIEFVAISEKWEKLAKLFERKKHHNISHLKELGIIFIIPTYLGFDGELIRTVALLAHYMNEIPFYADLFKRAAKDPETFSEKVISLLRGDVIDDRSKLQKGDWMIVQRYLAKDDENDWRLFEPHVDPEAIHWEKAEDIIARIGKAHGVEELAFWKNLNWVGDFYPTESGINVLVSFNLVDTAMSLVQKKELIKYLYHHQEAMWNKIFASYVGEEKMEEYIKENMISGRITFER